MIIIASGVYEIYTRILTVTAATHLICLTAPSNRRLIIISASITNEDLDTNEQILCSLDDASGTPAGTTITPRKHNEATIDSQATSRTSPTGMTPGSTPIFAEGVPLVSGFRFDPAEDSRPIVERSASVVLRTASAVSSFTAIARMTYAEI